MADSSVLRFRSSRLPGSRATGPDPIAAALALALTQVPPRPPAVTACVAYLQEDAQLLATREFGVRALLRLRDSLFNAPGRDAQMRNIWRESIATACASRQLARQTGLDHAVLTAAGLLHRVGDVWALTALARAEACTNVKLLGAAANESYAARDADLAARLMAAWQLTPEVSNAIVGWRSCLDLNAGNNAGPLSLAQAVYLGHLLAVEQLHSRYCTPGVIDAAALELGVSCDVLDAVRENSAGTDVLLERLS